MKLEEIKFAAAVRSVASEIRSEQRATAIQKIISQYNAEQQVGEIARWDAENCVTNFTVQALDELQRVSKIIRDQPKAKSFFNY